MFPWTQDEPSTFERKIDAAVYGLVAGGAVSVGCIVAAFVVGTIFSWVPAFMSWDTTGEYGAWMGLAFARYALVPAIAVGLLVSWRIGRARLRKLKSG